MCHHTQFKGYFFPWNNLEIFSELIIFNYSETLGIQSYDLLKFPNKEKAFFSEISTQIIN
jgi:hypothetical protein